MGKPTTDELIVSGSAGNDTIELITGSVIVKINGQVVGTFEDISNILLDGGDGSDDYTLPLGIVDTVMIADSGTTGDDSLTVETSGDTIVVNGDQITSGGQTITFSSEVETLELATGTGGGTVVVEAPPTASLTVGAVGDLVIHGTPGDDDIAFTPGSNSGEVEVTVNGAVQGTFTPTERIVAFGGDGNDDIHVAGNIGVSVWLYGGDGNDRLKGGGLDDLLLGGAGDDLLVGKSGRDLLIGGIGADRIIGNAGDDILIAAITAWDDNEVALLAIMNEWTRTDQTYLERVNHLTNGEGLNGVYVLNSETVGDDDEKDKLTGASGSDWFFFNSAQDRATDLKDEIFSNDLDFILSLVNVFLDAFPSSNKPELGNANFTVAVQPVPAAQYLRAGQPQPAPHGITAFDNAEMRGGWPQRCAAPCAMPVNSFPTPFHVKRIHPTPPLSACTGPRTSRTKLQHDRVCKRGREMTKGALSTGLMTDLYQLTMAYSYFKTGVHDREAVFHLFFRQTPFGGGYAIACGLAQAVEFLKNFRYAPDDIAYLQSLMGNDEEPLFDREFLDFLVGMQFSCDLDAMPEGTVAFAHEPLLRVTGPILQCQLIETGLLNIVNFQTLLATKSSRVCRAAQGESVLEFGLRRAQGPDGALSASRAAFVGGCAATSNVLAGKLFGIPVKGTHAHSWIMCFDSELEAFQTYADAMPNNCVFLVDTYDTLQGVRNAVTVGEQLRERGHQMVGIRLDSGDLATLSKDARRILDDAGFQNAAIVASNDLDEHLISSLKEDGATIGVWGVGTRLATAYDQPALGGVYKLAAIREAGGDWQHKIKISEQPIKTSNPGIQQVRRFYDETGFLADVIYDIDNPPGDSCESVDLNEPQNRRTIPDHAQFEDLLTPVLRDGSHVADEIPVAAIRTRALEQLAQLDERIKLFGDADHFPVGLEATLFELKCRLIEDASNDQ